MDDYKVDFHIHTTASDGEATPTQIVKRAKELDYDIIAITGHGAEAQIRHIKNAFNVMPDLLAPRMEIGVKVEKWETIRPTTVELLNN